MVRFVFSGASSQNEYSQNFSELFAPHGSVAFAPRYSQVINFIAFLAFSRVDVLFISWLDNYLLDKKGRLSKKRIFFVRTLLFFIKSLCGKVVFIRHNVYPHVSDKLNVESIQKSVFNEIVRKCDFVVCHAQDDSAGDFFIPHPPYKVNPNPSLDILSDLDIFVGCYFLMVGRVDRYKKIEEVINALGPRHKLIVAGKATDQRYLLELKKMGENKNVVFYDNYVPDKDLAGLIESAAAVIVNHTDSSCLVSGAFVHSASYGVPILLKDGGNSREKLKGYISSCDVLYTQESELKTALNNIANRGGGSELCADRPWLDKLFIQKRVELLLEKLGVSDE